MTGTPARMHPDVLIKFDDVWKSFGGRPAVAGVSLELRAGEILGLVGPNGAGKSTLIKMLDGVHRPDSGVISTIDGSPVASLVGIIHQELGIVPTLSVMENICLSIPGSGWRRWFLALADDRRRAREALDRVGLDVDVTDLVGWLTAGEQSLVAVARMLMRERRVLVLDETTAALPARSATWLFERVKALAAEGASVLVVSHRLGEIVETSDRVVVLVDGRVTVDRPIAGLDQAAIADAMSGGRLSRARATVSTADVEGEVLLELEGVAAGPLRGVDLEVTAGEVVGITGLLGSGLYDFARVAAGIDAPLAGKRRVAGKGPTAFVPPDRRAEGLFVDHPVQWNATVSSLRSFERFGLLDLTAERRAAERVCTELSVKMTGVEQPIRELSGGNQQKVLVARALLQGSRVIVLCEPTRGVDVHTRTELYALIVQLKADGAAIIVVSSDVEEVLTVSDRMGVVRDGELNMLDSGATSGHHALAELVM